MSPTGAPFCHAPVGEFDFYFGPETCVFSSGARLFRCCGATVDALDLFDLQLLVQRMKEFATRLHEQALAKMLRDLG